MNKKLPWFLIVDVVDVDLLSLEDVYCSRMHAD